MKKTTDLVLKNKLSEKISELEEDLRRLVHKKRLHDETKARHDLTKAPNDFFDLVRKISKKSDKVGPLKRTSKNKNWPTCEILSSQYSSIFSKPREEDIFTDPKIFFKEHSEEDAVTDRESTRAHSLPTLTSLETNHFRISNAIDKLPSRSAPGPDGITNYLIKQLKFELIPVLNVLFEKSLDTGILPSHYLKAYIKPIKKSKKPRSEPSSYCPVSLTSGLSKVFEHVLKPQLQSYLEDNDILSKTQHGFRPMRSCISQLLNHYNTVIEDLEQGKTTDVVYLDFAKAFDSVDIFILSQEMKKIGISGKAGVWIYNFLSGRNQQILADNQLSSPARVTSGVPQGTILGPTFFLIMINTLSETDLESRISMFADDTRVAKGIKSEEDVTRLQNDLDKVFEWQKAKNMDFNKDKFELLSHSHDFRSNRNLPKGQYLTDDGSSIKIKPAVRDLGIEISASSDFLLHISTTCKRA